MYRMKKTFKKVVITGAIALAPVMAANSAMAAPVNPVQQPNPMMNSNCSNLGMNMDLNSIFQDNSELKQILSKWMEAIQKEIGNKPIVPPPVQKPEVDKPEVNKPEVEKPEANKPEVEKPEVEKPEIEKPEVEKPEVNKPEVNKPEAEKPVTPGDNKPTTPQDNNNANSDFASQVIDLVNQERANAGLQPLKSDALLNKVAMIKAKDMNDNNYFDHQSPTLGSPFDLMRAQGVNFNTAGENIAKGQRNPQEVMNAWMNSDGHRKNILSSSFTSIGVAYYNGVWVQAFTG